MTTNISLTTTTVMPTTTTMGSEEFIKIAFLLYSIGLRVTINCIKSSNSTFYDMKKVDNDCFVLIYHEMTFGGALDFCQSLGGHMANIDQDIEGHLENMTLANEDNDFWIGLVYLKALERWIWLNGEEFTYKKRFSSDWVGSCVVWEIKDRTWNNIKCSNEKPFICKIPMLDDRENCEEIVPTMTYVTTSILPVDTNTTVTDDPTGVNLTTWSANITSTNIPDMAQNTTAIGTDKPVERQAQNAGFQGMLPLLVVLSALLALSLAVNLFFFVQFLCQCRRRTRLKDSLLPLDDMTMTSSHGAHVYNDTPRSLPAISVSAPQPVANNDDDQDDQSDNYVQMDSPAPKNGIDMQDFQVASSTPVPDDNIDDIIMIPNVVYNQDTPGDSNNGELNKERAQLRIDYANVKLVSSDKDNIYDEPVSPLQKKVPFETSSSDTDNRHYSLEVFPSAPNKGFEDGDVYYNETVSNDNRPEGLEHKGDNPFVQDNDSCHEGPYANTEF